MGLVSFLNPKSIIERRRNRKRLSNLPVDADEGYNGKFA